MVSTFFNSITEDLTINSINKYIEFKAGTIKKDKDD